MFPGLIMSTEKYYWYCGTGSTIGTTVPVVLVLLVWDGVFSAGSIGLQYWERWPSCSWEFLQLAGFD